MAAPGPQPPSSLLPESQAPAAGLQKAWQTRGPLSWALWPISLVYRALVAIRNGLYQRGWLATEHPGRPVIVVGNVIAGGAGKTPVVIALVKHLQSRGLRPGVISRGYGRTTADCRAVEPGSPAHLVGDEPALIARRCEVPVFVARRRITAARALLAVHPDTDVIVCDDGLQHLALARDLEVCIFNDQGVGNGFMLPAGPLREPWPRAVDFVLHAGRSAPVTMGATHSYSLQRRLASYAVRRDGTQLALSALRGQPVHAVAAVARPGDFFAMLQAHGLQLARAEALPDHYGFDSWERIKDNHYPLVCTEKDAVKLWPRQPDALAVPLLLHIDPGFLADLDARLQALRA